MLWRWRRLPLVAAKCATPAMHELLRRGDAIHPMMVVTGEEGISLEDYAVAMIDELEKPAHSRRRFTVGY